MNSCWKSGAVTAQQRGSLSEAAPEKGWSRDKGEKACEPNLVSDLVLFQRLRLMQGLTETEKIEIHFPLHYCLGARLQSEVELCWAYLPTG